MERSNIQWTNRTWNPVTGCNKISSGCKYCYAEKWAHMQQKRGIRQYSNGFNLTLAKNRLRDPLKLKSQNLIFVNSMSDLFHEDIPESYLLQIFKVMNEAKSQVFQILTKRPGRILSIQNKVSWSPNIWIGVSVESQDYIHRIDILSETISPNKFISFEPLIGPISNFEKKEIDWIIVGGESGLMARKMEMNWVMGLKKESESAHIPFYFKQWGKSEFNPDKSDPTLNKENSNWARGGCLINGQMFRAYPLKMCMAYETFSAITHIARL